MTLSKNANEKLYNDLKSEDECGTHRIAMAMDLEDGENTQYPLEDILDKYLVDIEESLVSDQYRTVKYIISGELESILDLKSIIGKRAFNKEFVDENGKTRVKLMIE
jgi:hypothetical protein